MSIEAFAADVYAKGYRPEHFLNLKDGMLLLEPVRPPQMTVGIHVPERARDIPGQFCLAHRIVAMAEVQPKDALKVNVGDIVKTREAHLDPIDPTGNLLCIRAEHIIGVISVKGEGA